MIFRFFKLEYDLEHEMFDYDKVSLICAYEEEKSGNELYKMLQLSKDYHNPIELKSNWYNVEDIVLKYNGDVGDMFVVDVYCLMFF